MIVSEHIHYNTVCLKFIFWTACDDLQHLICIHQILKKAYNVALITFQFIKNLF